MGALEEWLRKNQSTYNAVPYGNRGPVNDSPYRGNSGRVPNPKLPSRNSSGASRTSRTSRTSGTSGNSTNRVIGVRQSPIQTIVPGQYDPQKHILFEPEAAYSFNAGLRAGTLSPELGWNTGLPKASKDYRQNVKNYTPVEHQPLNDETKEFLRQIQLSDPWYTQAMFQNDRAQAAQMGASLFGPGVEAGGQYPDSDIERIMAAIASNETGGLDQPYSQINYNDPSGAFGKYQILGSNIPSWTQEALGRSLTPEQFLNDPAAQDATARYKMQQYYNQYGDAQSVARAWNAGEGFATNPNAVTGYVSKFMAAYGQGAPNPQATSFNDGWVSPVQGANLSSENYGWRSDPITGQQRFHGALDIGGGVGTMISAATGGQVLYAGYDGAWGNTVVMSDPTGQYHIRYAHLNDIWAAPGQSVQPGMQIGTMGNTGRSTGSHLHFEVTSPSGEYIDPRQFY